MRCISLLFSPVTTPRVFLLMAVALLGHPVVHAQYFQFSQYNFTSQRINPAMTAASRYASIDVDSRTQRTGGDFNINSNFFSAAYPLLNPSTGNPWSGIGISFIDDRSGGIFKRQEAALSYAIHIRVRQYQQFSLGFKALYASDQLTADGYTTGAQYVADRGFVGPNTGEIFQSNRTHYATFSTGLYWQQVNKQGDVIAHAGLSIFDLNKPAYSFYGNPTRLPASFVFSGSFQAYSANGNSILPEMLITNSSGTNVVNGGLRLRHELPAAIHQVPDKIDVLAKYAVGRSVILGFQFHRESFSFGVSYDFPFLKSNPSNLGALEVGLTLRKLVETKNKKEARRRALEKKKAVERIAQRKKVSPKVPPSVDTLKTTQLIPEVVVVKPDTINQSKSQTTVETSTKAGIIRQEPIIVEKATLHFHFDYNSIDLDDETKDYLSTLAETLVQHPKFRVNITGHTDNVGPAKFNLRLSQKRADAVRAFLVHAGIDAARIASTGKGLAEPLTDNDTEENQAKNRRVEIVVVRE